MIHKRLPISFLKGYSYSTLARAFAGWMFMVWALTSTGQIQMVNHSLNKKNQDTKETLYTLSSPQTGDGSAGNPFEIATLDHLAWIAEDPSRWTYHFVQTHDIDASATSGWFMGAGWVPIGNAITKFTGSYDGRGHLITNLYINRATESNIGLFGVLSGAVINHLHIREADITGGNNWIGILAGQAESGTVITHCYSSGSVFGIARVGGLIGYAVHSSTLITKCGSSATVTGHPSSSTGMYTGGLIGLITSSASVTESYTTGDVSGRFRVGGLIGTIGWNALAENCFATGDVTSNNTLSEVGGLVGEVWQGRLRFCYAKGYIYYGSATSNYGGLVGTANTGGNYEDYRNYWNTQTSGLSISAMGTGRNNNQMTRTSTYNGFDFNTIWDFNNNYNDKHPYLRQSGSAAFDGGNGTPGNPYQISNIFQLQAAKYTPNASNFIITCNFGAYISELWDAGQGFDPIGYYDGTILGDTHTISGITINRPGTYQAALVTSTGNNAIIRDLTLKDFTLNGSGNSAPLVGALGGQVENVYISANISAGSTSGGLIGQAYSSATITNCHTDVDISSTGNNIGGLVGYNNGGIIIDASAFGSVSGNNKVGGLVGKNEGSITYSSANTNIIASGNEVGGLIGWNNQQNINNCEASGSVTGNNRVGGLIGYSSGGGATISQCNSSADVTGNDEIGGLIGSVNGGTVELSYSTGSVNGVDRVGGLIGFGAYGNLYVDQCFSESPVIGTGEEIGGLIGRVQDSKISNSYARGSVEGGNEVGGLIGTTQWSGAIITNTFATGLVSGSNSGGLIGTRSQSSVNNSYWDMQTSNQNSSAGGVGKTTSQMLDLQLYMSSSWDFSSIWSQDPAINDGYPYLTALGAAFMLVWTGNIDTTWEHTGNWSLNRLPDLQDNIIIPNVPNKPVISSAAEVKGVNIQPNSRLSIQPGGSLTVLQTLNNNAGNQGLVIISNTQGTGSLIHPTGNVSATFQRYIPGTPEAWHTLASPVTAQPIAPEFTPPGTYGDGTGYDLYHWYEPDTSWIYFNSPSLWNASHPSSNFLVGKGYLVSYQEANPTKTFQGTLNSGNITLPVTHSTGSTDVFGFNLVGNPYPSSIDWKAPTGWNRSPLELSSGGYNLWIWNDTAFNYGVYNSSSSGDFGTLGTSRFIAPTQGFFVKASQNGSLTMSNNIRNHQGANIWLRGSKEYFYQLTLQVESASGYGADQIMVEFGHQDNEGGALKKFSFVPSAPAIFIPFDEQQYSLRMLHTIDQHPVIPVSFQTTKPGKYTFKAQYDKYSFPVIYLDDLKTGITHNLLASPTYTFISEDGDEEERFVLRFKEGGFPNPHLSLPAEIYTSGANLYADLRLLPANHSYDLYIYALTGQLLLKKTLPGGELYILSVPEAASSVVVGHLTGKEGKISRKVCL